MIIDCIADLHGYFPKLEGGDLLIVAGDLTARDKGSEYATFLMWIAEQNYRCKIVIAGNHDTMVEKGKYHLHGRSQYGHPQDELYYLQDSGTEFEGLKVWGSPWTKTFEGMNPRCKAFTVDTEEELAEKWELIPKDIDILITHGPPYGILDYRELEDGTYYHMGSKSLEDHLFYNINSSLEYHIFGHIHECGSKIERTHSVSDKYTSINCSHVNEQYQPVNKPVKIEL